MPIRSLAQSFMLATLLTAGQQLCIASTGNAQAQFPEAQQPTVADIPDQKLDAAATALVTVDRVQKQYQEQLRRIAEDAKKAAEKAVTDQGLSVDEFETIMVAAKHNPDVRQKLVRRLPSIE